MKTRVAIHESAYLAKTSLHSTDFIKGWLPFRQLTLVVNLFWMKMGLSCTGIVGGLGWTSFLSLYMRKFYIWYVRVTKSVKTYDFPTFLRLFFERKNIRLRENRKLPFLFPVIYSHDLLSHIYKSQSIKFGTSWNCLLHCLPRSEITELY